MIGSPRLEISKPKYDIKFSLILIANLNLHIKIEGTKKRIKVLCFLTKLWPFELSSFSLQSQTE